MDLGIRGKRALVCAASRGLGQAIAAALADEGVQLLLCARDTEALEKTAKDLVKSAKGEVHTFACDLSQSDSRHGLVSFVERTFGDVDILIHNVGGPKPSLAEATTVEDWTKAFQQLLLPVVHLNNAFLPAMKKNSWGRIVCVTSLSVIEPIANLTLSNGMRSAVTGMLKTLADEVAASNVTVNCVAPGLIRTARTEDLMEARIAASGQTREEYMREYVKSIPSGRLGEPEEFGSVVAFLCSQQASYITGSTICVDGGKRRSVH
ncbi:MAG TPA: SDR family oxidoreductase [Candidatus Obscuribacterales bacterium]